MPLAVLQSYDPPRSLRGGAAVHVSIHNEKPRHWMALASGSPHSRSIFGRMTAEKCQPFSVPATDTLNGGQSVTPSRHCTTRRVKLRGNIPIVRAVSSSQSAGPTPVSTSTELQLAISSSSLPLSPVPPNMSVSGGISSTRSSSPISSDSSTATNLPGPPSPSSSTTTSSTSGVRPPASEPSTISTTRLPTSSISPSSALLSLPSTPSPTYTRSSSTSENESLTSSVTFSDTSHEAAPISTSTSSLAVLTGQLSRKTQPTVTSFTSTSVTTNYVASTMENGQTTTLSTVSTAVTSGTLGNEPNNDTGFSRNTGAIIGVSVASAIVLLVGALIVFFTCKRYRERRMQSDNHSSHRALNVSSPRLSWRPPIDEDDYFHAESYSPIIAAMQLPPVGEPNPTLSNDRLDKMAASVSGRASLSQQGYLPGFGQAAEVMAGADIARKASDVTSSGYGHRTPSSQDHRLASSGNTSLVSIGRNPSLPSSQSHTATASSSRALLVPSKRSPEDKRSPPTSYKGKEKAKEPDTGSIRSLFARLRGGRSIPRLTIEVPQTAKATSEEALTSPASFYPRPHSLSSYYPPPPSSLLNPPSPETGPYLNRDSPQMLSVSGSNSASFAANTQPQLSLVPPPLPMVTPPSSEDTRITRDGLLRPNLSPQQGYGFPQASFGSLHDNVDYSRPISGVVNNRMYSSTTITTQDTQDTADTEDGHNHV